MFLWEKWDEIGSLGGILYDYMFVFFLNILNKERRMK